MHLKEKIEAVLSHEADADVRVCRNLPEGGALHQGDVYLHRVPDNWPRGKQLGTRQVAVGQTQGSRHIAEGAGVQVCEGKKLPASFRAPKWLNGTPPEGIFLGPVVVAEKRWSLSHPEHAKHTMPAGVYQVTYQGDPRMMARVSD
jgi:hypothetical protein